jgi:RNA polymerase sigma-70 factor (ECF subfamily)
MVSKRAESDERSRDASFPTVELVEKAQAGDQTAFHRLVDHYQPEIYRMIYYRSRSKMDAEDLTQDVMLKAYKNIGHLKTPGVFRSWLFRIAVNRVRDYYRKKQFRSLFGMVSMDDDSFHESPETAIAPEAEGGISRKDFWRQIEQMLGAFSRMEKEVFLLRFLDQMTIKEISATLKKNESTVKTHLYRALHKAKAMAGHLDGLMEGI